MSVKQQKETRGFETEVKQLLKLMINALYSNKEIFLRELISNASDAADRLRFEALSDSALMENDPDLKIQIDFDKKHRTITIRDNGIGMSRDEVVSHLGTIAKSGTKDFLASLTGDQAKDSKLIGQFGVGFYSAFIVADKVTVLTRRAGLTEEHGVCWESAGEGDYTIENVDRKMRGTEVILHLRKEEEEFLESYRLRSIVTKYSDHIMLPIFMLKEDDKGKKTEEWAQVNRATALWALPKNEIKEEEYKALYKHISHDFEDPLLWGHHRVEGKLEYTSLLYIPARAPFNLYDRQHQHGLKLYIKRVFIMDEAEQFLPSYLRFVKGIIDANDLPLNISREILQRNPMVEKIRSGLVKRILEMLEKLSKDEPESYLKFWKELGRVLKEGPAEDFENREKIAKLLRFSSTQTDQAEQTISLEDYVSRMKSDQKKIYYITADSFMAAKNSPYLEVFRKAGIEVLLLSDRVDEWLVGSLNEFDGKPLQSIAKGELDSEIVNQEESKDEQKKDQETYEGFLKQVKEVLGEKIKEARLTYRLTQSPACIVADETDLNINMQRILKSVGQDVPEMKAIFEINPNHDIVQRLKDEQDDAQFRDWVEILFDQAVLAEGGQLKDPASFVAKMNQLLLRLAR